MSFRLREPRFIRYGASVGASELVRRRWDVMLPCRRQLAVWRTLRGVVAVRFMQSARKHQIGRAQGRHDHWTRAAVTEVTAE